MNFYPYIKYKHPTSDNTVTFLDIQLTINMIVMTHPTTSNVLIDTIAAYFHLAILFIAKCQFPIYIFCKSMALVLITLIVSLFLT